MSEFGGLWKYENNQHAFVPPKTECGCRSGGGIKNGDIRSPSYAGTQKTKVEHALVKLGSAALAADVLLPMMKGGPNFPKVYKKQTNHVDNLPLVKQFKNKQITHRITVQETDTDRETDGYSYRFVCNPDLKKNVLHKTIGPKHHNSSLWTATWSPWNGRLEERTNVMEHRRVQCLGMKF